MVVNAALKRRRGKSFSPIEIRLDLSDRKYFGSIDHREEYEHRLDQEIRREKTRRTSV